MKITVANEAEKQAIKKIFSLVLNLHCDHYACNTAEEYILQWKGGKIRVVIDEKSKPLRESYPGMADEWDHCIS